jgi:hypothetical protein
MTLALRLIGFTGVLIGSLFVAFGGRSTVIDTAPVVDADIGLGAVLVAGINATDLHSNTSQQTADAGLGHQLNSRSFEAYPPPPLVACRVCAPRPVPDLYRSNTHV